MTHKILALGVALAGGLFLATSAQAQSKAEISSMLKGFQTAWSTQDTDAILAFFSDEFTFEDAPLGLTATNKEELRALLDYTFASVPNFTMDITAVYQGDGFVATKWTQSGNATVEEMNLKNHPYAVTTTSIITFADDGLIASVFDNWNVGSLSQ